MNKISTSVNIAGVVLKNPVVTASGTFGFGREFSKFYDLSKLGGVTVKGLTLKEKLGNKMPRVAETNMGMLNSIGLQNPGVEYFLKYEMPFLKQYDTKIIANIAGNTIDEYCEMTKILSHSDVDLIEVNISCPNVKQGGVAFGVDKKNVYEVTSKIKAVSKKPIIIKLSPNVTDIKEMAKAAVEGGADALSLINTLIGMKIDIKTKRPVLANNIGGFSGPAIMPVAVRMVYEAASTVNVPIIGMGGISNWQDAIEFMIAGASAVAVGSAALVNPYSPVQIADGIEDYMMKNNILSVTQITKSIIPN